MTHFILCALSLIDRIENMTMNCAR